MQLRVSGYTSSLGVNASGDVMSIRGIGGDLVYFLDGVGLRPYLVGGVSSVQVRVGTGITETGAGVRAGGGLSFSLANGPSGSAAAFGEASYNWLNARTSEVRLLQVILGVHFAVVRKAR
jgi:hypothetical protein